MNNCGDMMNNTEITLNLKTKTFVTTINKKTNKKQIHLVKDDEMIPISDKQFEDYINGGELNVE